MNHALLRFGPISLLLLFAVTGIAARMLVQRAKHGTFGLGAVGGAGTLPIAIVVLLLVAQSAAQAVSPLDPLADSDALRIAGLVLALFANALMVRAQLDLGASWRIGIEKNARPGLVTGGFYRVCRNPIFLFMLLALAGHALLLPTALSAVLLAASILSIRMQVRVEEKWLLASYGSDYRDFAARVGRFTPWTGRL